MKRAACACVLVAAGLVSSGSQAASRRLTAIVSDVHLDAGREDAERAEALSQLLAELSDRGDGAVDLILNGDVFDLLGPEAETAGRLDLVLDEQPALRDALRAFAQSGGNRVVFVPGDHDAALLLPELAARLRERTGGEVATAGRWVSEDGRIVAEHGHQLPGDPYRFEDWPRPFTAEGGLASSIGARALAPVFARLESKFPVVDDFATRLSGLRYGASIETSELPSPELVKLLLVSVSWQQFRRDLELEVEPPEWDLDAIRAAGDDFLLASMPEDDPLHDVVHRSIERSKLSSGDLSDEEVRLLCDYRAAVRRARRRMERGLTQMARVGPVVAECPRTESSREPSFSYFWSSRDAPYRERLVELSRGLERPPDAYVHGHTHLVDRGFAPGGGDESPRIVNAGAFRRVLTPAELEAMGEARGTTIAELMASLRVEDLSACYSLVLVEPYEEQPSPQVWYWSSEGMGEFEMTSRCGD